MVMISTHVLMGGAIGLSSLYFMPEAVLPAVMAGMLGGLLPDFDSILTHRKTLHRPFQYTLVSVLLLLLATVSSSVYLVFALFLAVSLAVHSFVDILTVQRSNGKAVYNHLTGEWISTTNLFPTRSYYDTLIALTAAVPLAMFFSGLPQIFIGLMVAYSVFYPHFSERIDEVFLGDYPSFSDMFDAKLGIGGKEEIERR